MFFPAEKVLEAVRRNIALTETGRSLYRELFPRDPFSEVLRRADDVDTAIQFILALPSAIEQEKIFLKLTKLAEDSGAEIDTFQWWSIDRREHRIFANLSRDGQRLLISFLWNEVQKGRASSIPPAWAGGRWIRDLEAPQGYRFEFQHEEYHHTVAMYEKWLREPLPPIPA